MAPDQRHPGKAPVNAWVPQQLKEALVARADADGLTQTDILVAALEHWLNAEKRPSAEAEGRGKQEE